MNKDINDELIVPKFQVIACGLWRTEAGEVDTVFGVTTWMDTPSERLLRSLDTRPHEYAGLTRASLEQAIQEVARQTPQERSFRFLTTQAGMDQFNQAMRDEAHRQTAQPIWEQLDETQLRPYTQPTREDIALWFEAPIILGTGGEITPEEGQTSFEEILANRSTRRNNRRRGSTLGRQMPTEAEMLRQLDNLSREDNV